MAAELSLEELGRRIASGAVRMAAATAAWLALVAEFDRREGWGAIGVRSCAHWLSWQCGLSPGSAREHVRVARALTVLPQTRAAFAGGRLSFSKVRALTRVADPATEGELLQLAHEASAAQVERVVRQWRRSDRTDEQERRERNRREQEESSGESEARRVALERRFDSWWDDDGMLHVRMCLDAEEGAAFLAGVESLVERDARRERAAAQRAAGRTASDAPAPDRATSDDEAGLVDARERATARRCAAVARLASAAAAADRQAGDPPRREVVVHVDAAVLADDAAAGRAYLEGGPALRPATVRRMLCEATVVSMVERGREPLALGRARRFASRAQRRALFARDGGCARPGCHERRVERLHAHHLRHWLFGGRTDLDNLVLLCDTDHGLAHDQDLVLTRRDGRLIATTPDGRRVWGAADAAFTTGIGAPAGTDEAFAGVHPIDQARGRRPADADPTPQTPAHATARPATGPSGGRPAPSASITRLLFPDSEPDLPDAMHVNGEPMDLAYVVGVLLGNRDLDRRLAAGRGTTTGRGAAA
ncbi:DUF222 domain-containing protein [Blastococcus sp. SYSU D00820]